MRPMTSELHIQSDQCWSKGTINCNTRWWSSGLFSGDKAISHCYCYSSASAMKDWRNYKINCEENLPGQIQGLLTGVSPCSALFRENCHAFNRQYWGAHIWHLFHSKCNWWCETWRLGIDGNTQGLSGLVVGSLETFISHKLTRKKNTIKPGYEKGSSERETWVLISHSVQAQSASPMRLMVSGVAASPPPGERQLRRGDVVRSSALQYWSKFFLS